MLTGGVPEGSGRPEVGSGRERLMGPVSEVAEAIPKEEDGVEPSEEDSTPVEDDDAVTDDDGTADDGAPLEEGLPVEDAADAP
jgi:hypothetical protein